MPADEIIKKLANDHFCLEALLYMVENEHEFFKEICKTCKQLKTGTLDRNRGIEIIINLGANARTGEKKASHKISGTVAA